MRATFARGAARAGSPSELFDYEEADVSERVRFLWGLEDLARAESASAPGEYQVGKDFYICTERVELGRLFVGVRMLEDAEPSLLETIHPGPEAVLRIVAMVEGVAVDEVRC